MRRVWLRAGGLVLLGVAVLIGLTVYFSAERVPPCLVSGAPRWRPPTDSSAHRFLLVVPDRALCFFDMNDDHRLVGYVKLRGIEEVTAAAPGSSGKLALRYGGGRGALVDLVRGRVELGVAPPPPPSDAVRVLDRERSVEYTTRRGELGFRVIALDSGRLLARVTFTGFTWNPRFGPDPPDHGLSLAPDRPELWVLDAPNGVVHLLDVSAVPRETPRAIDDIRLSKPLSGDENPCSHRCGRIGWLEHSADGRFVYVGDSGDVIDTAKRESVTNLEALHNSRVYLQVDWTAGRPIFPGRGARQTTAGS